MVGGVFQALLGGGSDTVDGTMTWGRREGQDSDEKQFRGGHRKGDGDGQEGGSDENIRSTSCGSTTDSAASRQQKQPESRNQNSHTIEEAEAEEGPFNVDLKRMVIAEIFGTALFVQIGGAAQCALRLTQDNEHMPDTPAPLVWAVALTVGIYVSASLSGGHLNPALSLAFALARPADFGFRKLLPYILSQLAGSVLGSLTSLFLFHQALRTVEENYKWERGTTASIHSAAAFANFWSLNDDYVRNGVHAFFIEACGTLCFTFCVFALTNSRNPLPGVILPPLLGFVYGSLVATLGPLTGGVLNPARDVGPRLVLLCLGWGWTAIYDILPYVLGPLLGAPVGAFLADRILYI